MAHQRFSVLLDNRKRIRKSKPNCMREKQMSIIEFVIDEKRIRTSDGVDSCHKTLNNAKFIIDHLSQFDQRKPIWDFNNGLRFIKKKKKRSLHSAGPVKAGRRRVLGESRMETDLTLSRNYIITHGTRDSYHCTKEMTPNGLRLCYVIK